MDVSWRKHILKFRFDAGTSRGTLKHKKSCFIIIRNDAGTIGIGECSLLPGLSIDDRPDFEAKIDELCTEIQRLEVNSPESLSLYLDDLIGNSWPSLRMGFETAYLDYVHEGRRIIFNNDFLNGKAIPINGLIWMGDKQLMLDQVKQIIESGYSCIKMKIGALDFRTELEILKYIRDRFPADVLTLRVDANGAFSPENVMNKLNQLEKFRIHSIEQPLKAGQWEHMYELCRNTPVPIGLDEELIGDFSFPQKKDLVQNIKPQFLILKPSMLGGFSATNDWIRIAESLGIGWWITSALESNIGLNAICQFTYDHGKTMVHGLGTGKLYENNIDSPLETGRGYIRYNKNRHWDLSILDVECIQ
jgi:o-succinylbenzoate synthase